MSRSNNKRVISKPSSCSQAPVIINFDELIEKPTKYKQLHPFMPDRPFRLLICGAGGQGKTNLLLNILLKPLVYYDKLYLYTKTTDQDKYQYLIQKLDGFNKKVGYKILECSNGDPTPIDEMDGENQKVVVFDDYICEKQDKLIEYFIRGRNKGCSCIYLSQSYFKTPKDIRLNCSHFCLFGVKHKGERDRVAREIGVEDYEIGDATKEPFSFLWVDNVKNKRLKNFRENI